MNTLLATTLVALSFVPTFEEGVQAYDAQNFRESANRFEELVYNRVYEPEVFYNLGNAYYDGSGVDVDHEEARRLYVIACDGGVGYACESLQVRF